VNTAAVPLNVTLVAPIIPPAAPAWPEVACVSTNGPRPKDRLNIVPPPPIGAAEVVP
jgi:hypothetical protein